MSRRFKILVAVAAAGVLASAVGLWALPEIVRRVALDQIPKVTGRAASIEDVDLNLFTGRVAIKRFRLAERDGPEAFVEMDRLDLGISLFALLASEIRITDLVLTAPTLRVTRAGPAEFNFSDILARFATEKKERPPSRWTVTLDRLALASGRFIVEDRAVSPAADWSIQGLGIEASGLTTRIGAEPGRLALRARLGSAAVEVAADSVRLAPVGATARISLTGFDLTRGRSYLAPTLPVSAEAGMLTLALTGRIERDGDALKVLVGPGSVTLEAVVLRQRDARGLAGAMDRLTVEVKEADLFARTLAGAAVTLEGLAVTRGGESIPSVKLPRLAVEVKEANLSSREATVSSVEVDGLDLTAVRDRDGKLDLLTALEAGRARDGEQSPAPGEAPVPTGAAAPSGGVPKVRIERLSVKSSRVALTDETVSPARQWRLEGLTVDGAGFSTAAEDPPGKLTAKTQIATAPGSGPPASLSVTADPVRLAPLGMTARVVLTGLDVTSVVSYVPETVPALPARGGLAADLTAVLEMKGSGLARATASGSVRLADLDLIQRGAPAPFLSVPQLALMIKQADAVSRRLDLGTIRIEAPQIRAIRGPDGRIDLLALAGRPAEAGGASAAPIRAPATPAPPGRPAPTSPGPSAPASAWRLSLDRLALDKGTVSFEDRAVSPVTTLPLTDVAVTVENFTWPSAGPATLSAAMTMPGGGSTDVKATVVVAPLDARIVLSTTDAPIEPYGAYFPFAARFAGLFSGDSVNEIKMEDGKLRAASRGNARARDIEIRDPGAPAPVARVKSFEISGIDFSWPNYALVDRVTLTRPEIRVERDHEGNFNLRRLFAGKILTGAAEPAPTTPSPAPGAAPAPATAKEASGGGLLQTMVLDFNEIVIADGFARFLDRSTTPAFSEDISRLALTIRDLSNSLGRKHTTMTAQALVGGDAALDMRGDLSGIGESLRADLVGELRDFTLSAANPYADSFASWIISRGRLAAKVHYRIEGDRLIAEHDMTFGGLKVEKSRESDEATKRIGLPLGLVVALLKDSRGDITFSLPLDGSLSDRKFNWGEAIWAGIKQVIGKVLLSPFSAIGRLFRGGDNDKTESLEVNPVKFPAGSAVVAPEMDTHLTRVADFLRRSPYVKLALSPIVTAEDAESLKTQELTARIQKLQGERKLADFAAAVAVYVKEQKIEGPPPGTPEEQLTVLRRREPVPEPRVKELLDRRLGATRDVLTRVEGIPAERLKPADPQRQLDKPGEGRVEFAFVEE